MTEGQARHAVRKVPAKGGLYVGRLLALLGAVALVYAWALNPVLASLRTTAERDARQSALARQVERAATRNRKLAAELGRDEQALARDSRRASSLQATLAALRRQKPPAPTASPSIGGVAVPTVQATTGASGIP
jgi:hypothetical protein